MIRNGKTNLAAMLMAVGFLGWASGAGADTPARLAKTQSGANGRFVASVDQTPAGAVSLYLDASGGAPAVNKAGGNKPALYLLALLGGAPPAQAVVEELTARGAQWEHMA
jgi:hypothetical protein